jgi:protein-glutamine gamma-glutamyltransferase
MSGQQTINQHDFNHTALPIAPIAIAQQLALLPLYFFIPFWIAVVNLLVCSLVIYSAKTGKLKLSKWIKLAVTLIAIGLVLFSFKKFTGRDAGVALIAVMYGLKLFETNTRRDAHLLLSLGFFIIVSGFLFNQSPWIALYQILPVVAILNALIAVHSLSYLHAPTSVKLALDKSVNKQSHQKLQRRQRVALFKSLTKYLLLALPIMVVLFVFFPRLSNPLWRMPGASAGTTGVSNSMTPGDISSLKLSQSIAFRAKFDGQEPNSNQLYWRVLVLDGFDGITWRRKGTSQIELPIKQLIEQDKITALAQEIFDYSITLEPTRQNFLVALDQPIDLPDDARLLRDFTSFSRERIFDRSRYQVKSWPNLKVEQTLSDERKALYRELPEEGNPQSKQWAQLQRQLYETDFDYIQGILNKINQQPYFYTLTPPIMEFDMVDSFWFDYKKGFCEHYAGALAYLARAANIPARVVIGYQGGDKNPLSNYWIVRSANAHAWTEIWFEGKGWVRVDPTAAIAPQRVEEMLMPDFRQRDTLFDNFDFIDSETISWLKQFEYWQDQFNNRWNDWILDYNQQTQRDFFKHFGFNALSHSEMIILMIVALLVFVAISSSQWLHHAKKGSAIARAYQQLLKQLAANKLVAYDPKLGPMALKQKLIAQGQVRHRAVIKLIDEYIFLQYQAEQVDQKRLKQLIKQMKNLPLKKRARTLN